MSTIRTSNIRSLNNVNRKVEEIVDNTILDAHAAKTGGIHGAPAGERLVYTGGSAALSTAAITDTTDATSTADAPLKSAGGLAVAKRSFFGGDVAYKKRSHRFFIPMSSAAWGTGKQLRVRFSTGAGVKTIRALLTAYSEAPRTNIIDKRFAGNYWGDGLGTPASHLVWAVEFAGGDVDITWSGVTGLYDLVFKHPVHDRTISELNVLLEIDSSSDDTSSIVDTVIEDIPA